MWKVETLETYVRAYIFFLINQRKSCKLEFSGGKISNFCKYSKENSNLETFKMFAAKEIDQR